MAGRQLLRTRDELVSIVLDESRSLTDADYANVFTRYHEAIARDRAEVFATLAVSASPEKAKSCGGDLVDVLIAEAQSAAATALFAIDVEALADAIRQAFARRLLEVCDGRDIEGTA